MKDIIRKELERKKGSLYIIEFDKRHVKIGVSINPSERLKTLQAQSGIYIKRSWISPKCVNFYALEKEMHNFFDEHRKISEYFDIDFDNAVSIALQLEYVTNIPDDAIILEIENRKSKEKALICAVDSIRTQEDDCCSTSLLSLKEGVDFVFYCEDNAFNDDDFLVEFDKLEWKIAKIIDHLMTQNTKLVLMHLEREDREKILYSYANSGIFPEELKPSHSHINNALMLGEELGNEAVYHLIERFAQELKQPALMAA